MDGAFAGFGVEFGDFGVAFGVALKAALDPAPLPDLPFLPESPAAGFCTTFFKTPPVVPAPVTIFAAPFSCGFSPAPASCPVASLAAARVPAGFAPATVAGFSGTEGSRCAKISAARPLLLSLIHI